MRLAATRYLIPPLPLLAAEGGEEGKGLEVALVAANLIHPRASSVIFLTTLIFRMYKLEVNTLRSRQGQVKLILAVRSLAREVTYELLEKSVS
jgi:hypothetical protein